MIKHDTVRASCTQKDNSTTLSERLIAIAGFAFVGVALVQASSWF